ncbi:Rrf2 family transcriptional regulator [Sulfurimonas sp.]|uniref:RrF2 family transcriptional regulator n=1 Tax=Sulfurimonas sp. TaxID=2022749 RepID=UPI00356B3835
MAIISTKGSYGLTAVVILAQGDNQLLQIKDIASKGDIPQNYLEQILVLLKKAGLVESIRGANGGYKLAKDKSLITVYEVLDALECCLSESDSNTKQGLLEPFWSYTQKQIKGIFLLSIKELEEFLEENSEHIMFHI